MRLDTPKQLIAMNALYDQMRAYYNLFQPVLHLCEKRQEGDQIKRKWDQAQTPYHRLLQSGILSQTQQERLQVKYRETNPLQLRQHIDQQLETLWDTHMLHGGVLETTMSVPVSL